MLVAPDDLSVVRRHVLGISLDYPSLQTNEIVGGVMNENIVSAQLAPPIRTDLAAGEDKPERLPEDPDAIETSQVTGPSGGSNPASQSAAIPPDLLGVLDDADAAVLLLDDAGFFVYVNEAARSLLRYSNEEIVGAHFTGICIHDVSWLEIQFQRLKTNDVWSGHIVLRGKHADVGVAVNAATLLRPSSGLSYIAVIHSADVSLPTTADLEELPFGLTAAEVHVLQLLIEGFSTADISVLQGVSESAVVASIEVIQRKLRVSSLVEACVLALKKHLIA